MREKKEKSFLATVRDELALVLGRKPDAGETIRYAFEKIKEQAREDLNAPPKE